MRLKTQLLISIITFSIILAIIGSSVAITQQQITELNKQSVLTNEIQTGASDLNYISNNYFLYQDNSYIASWQTKFSTLSSELAKLNSTNPQQQTLVKTVGRDLDQLNTVFAGVTSFLSNAPRNVSIRVLPSFQTQWNRMAVQIQAIAFDSQQLSQNIQDQTNQAILINTILTVALLSIFVAFFIMIYFVAYQRTARSITKLKNGIGVIGSGNLDYTIEAGKKDEIEDISKSVNQMAANLKTVTASKTDLEQAQVSLRESEQRWATTLASIGDAVIATDTSGKIAFMNGEAEKLTGWLLSETLSKPVKTVFNIINEQSRLEVESPIERVLKEGMVVGLANHTVLIRKDGSEVPIDDSGAPIKDKEGKTTGVVLIFRDITERKRAEETLRYNELLLTGFFDSIGQMRGIVEVINDKDILHVKDNEVTARYVGLTPADLKGKLSSELGEPAERIKTWIEHYKQSQKTGKPVTWEYTDREVSKVTWLSPTVTYIGKSSEGNPRFTYVVTDITERKKAEEALSKINEELEERVQKRTQEVSSERQRLYNVLETLPAYVVLLDKDYRMPFANKVFRETFGESHGRRCYEYLFGRNSECENCETYKVLKTNKPQHWEWTGPNGHNYEIYDYPFVEADGSTLILEMGLDVTERKKAERQAQEATKKLQDSERLAAIGATAGMVGHDIRNPLQAITGDLFLAKTELSELPDNENKTNAIESLDEIQNNIDYINKIVADLQDYARPLNPRAQETDVESVFNEILSKNGVPKNVKVSVNIEDKAKRIMADPDYLKRIAANLTLNAVQAMPEGGKLTIHAYVDKQTNDVLITVKDTGVGIREDVKPKLFTPMMTTKSKGQGFGLAVVKRMTEGLGGTVTFESTEGKGTTFIVRLPPPQELNGKWNYK